MSCPSGVDRSDATDYATTEPARQTARFYFRPERVPIIGPFGPGQTSKTMKIRNSLKALKTRHRENRLVRRKGRVYIINKSNPRFKARQG